MMHEEYRFDSRLNQISNTPWYTPGEFSDEALKNEPMFFNASLDFAFDNGGPITKKFIHALPSDWCTNDDTVIDTRVHMLMPGWFPCIPGWHHDDVARDKTGQPDYDDPAYHANHLMTLVNADVAPTQFLLDEVYVPRVPEGQVIYRVWDRVIDEFINRGKIDRSRVVSARSGIMYEFDCDTFHRGVPARKNGWRWFARISKDTVRVNHKTDEFRRQVQVYLDPITQGW